MFLPVVNLLIFPVIWVETIRSFGKKSFSDTLLVLLTLGLYTYTINYSNKIRYIEDRDLNPASGFGEWLSSIIFAITLATVVHTYFIQAIHYSNRIIRKNSFSWGFSFCK